MTKDAGLRCGPDRSRLEHHCVSFIASDDAVELSEVLGFIDRYAEFLYLKGAGIADDVAIHNRPGVITGKAVVRVDGRWQVINSVADRDCDFKRIRIARWPLEFDGLFPGFLGFQKPRTLVSDHAGPHQEQIAGIFGVVHRLEGIVKAEGLVAITRKRVKQSRNARSARLVPIANPPAM
jgi:hypothetical protein